MVFQKKCTILLLFLWIVRETITILQTRQLFIELTRETIKWDVLSIIPIFDSWMTDQCNWNVILKSGNQYLNFDMKQLNCVLFNIFFSLTVSLSTGQNTTRHENVQPATVKVPWLVSMQVHAWHYCGGSIIAHQWILTSAFCTRYFKWNYKYQIQFLA